MEKTKKKSNKFKKLISYIYYFIRGKILISIYYDKKLLKSRWFKSPHKSLGAKGWKWVVINTRMNKKMGKHNAAKWPYNPLSTIIHSENIEFDYDDLQIFQNPGCYFQAAGRIVIGKGTWIAPNVGLITSNHDINDLDKHQEPRNIIIGEKCWIGMNSIILPGVVLGNKTIVGAGSVVTKSFEGGNCLIAGSPARIIKTYD